MKTKFLLPLVSLTTLASTTPILASCNKDKSVDIKLDQIFLEDEDMISSQLISIKRGETVHFSWNYSQLEEWSSQPSLFMFMFMSYLLVDEPMIISMYLSSCSMNVNGEPLLLAFGDTPDEIPNKSFTAYPMSSSGQFLGFYGIYFRYDNLSQNDNIELVYTSTRYQDEFYAVSAAQ